MKRMLVHIGTPKTGSTSIQASLFSAERHGQLGKVSYVPPNAFGKEVPGGWVATLYRPAENLPRTFRSRLQRDPDGFARDVAAYREAMSQTISEGERLILSSEYLAALDRHGIASMSRDLQAMGVEEIRVAVYVREPTSMYASAIQQRLKASHRVPEPQQFHYDFRGIIERWEEAFPGALVVRAFGLQPANGWCVVRDFLSVAGGYLEEDFSGVPVVRRNESISIEAVRIMQRYREQFHEGNADIFTKDSMVLLKSLRKVGETIPGGRLRLRPWTRREVHERHSKDLEWLSERYGIQFPEIEIASEEECEPRDGTLLSELVEPWDGEVCERMLLAVIGDIISGMQATKIAARNRMREVENRSRSKKFGWLRRRRKELSAGFREILESLESRFAKTSGGSDESKQG